MNSVDFGNEIVKVSGVPINSECSRNIGYFRMSSFSVYAVKIGSRYRLSQGSLTFESVRSQALWNVHKRSQVVIQHLGAFISVVQLLINVNQF